MGHLIAFIGTFNSVLEFIALLFLGHCVSAGFFFVFCVLVLGFAPHTRLCRWTERYEERHVLFLWEIPLGKYLWSECLKWRRGRRGPPPRLALEASQFRKLPPELISGIASHLPPESAACLALSSYVLYSCLEEQCLQSLKEVDPSILRSFLTLVERDLSHHTLCPPCNKFHPICASNWHERCQYDIWSELRPACCKADIDNGLKDATHSGFSSTIFRMLMKTHRQGRDTSKLLRLLASEPWGSKILMISDNIKHRSITARIHNDSLLLREQQIWLTPASQQIPIPKHTASIGICHHIRFLTRDGMYDHGIEIPYSDRVQGYENKQGLLYCQYCHSEFRVDFRSYGGGNAMFVTKWIDLGKGDDPNDPNWTVRDSRNAWEDNIVSYTRGSICAAFEQKPASEFKFDALISAGVEKQLKSRPWFQPKPCELSFEVAEEKRRWQVRDGLIRSKPRKKVLHFELDVDCEAIGEMLNDNDVLALAIYTPYATTSRVLKTYQMIQLRHNKQVTLNMKF